MTRLRLRRKSLTARKRLRLRRESLTSRKRLRLRRKSLTARQTNPETWSEQHVAYKNNDNDDDYDDGVAADEAAAIAEEMAQAAAQNVTMQVLMANKRPRTEPEPTEPAEPEEADFYVILPINTPSRTPVPKDLA